MGSSPALNIHGNMKETLIGRTIAVLIADGTDAAALTTLRKTVEKAGATLVLIAPKIGGPTLSDGKKIKVDGQLQGSPSQLFDAVAVLTTEAATETLLRDGAAVQWVRDAFSHLKAIGYVADSKPLLDKAGITPDEGVVETSKGFVEAASKRYWAREPKVRNLA